MPVHIVAFTELGRASTGWVEPYEKDAPKWTLRENYSPGNLAFDPLGMAGATEAEKLEMREKELANGRLAMIAVMGFMTQEIVSGSAIF